MNICIHLRMTHHFTKTQEMELYPHKPHKQVIQLCTVDAPAACHVSIMSLAQNRYIVSCKEN
jgi:hypothetical protein